MKLEDRRKETPFAARDRMLDIWKHVTELCFRGFGKKPRKMPKEPKNFSQWSEESRQRWYETQKAKLEQYERFDWQFILRETDVLDNLCRKIVFNIDGANTLSPYYIFECDKQRKMQNKAIKQCSNLKRELNHVMDSIPSNKNFIVKLESEIDKEIQTLRGWKQSCNDIRKKVIENEIKQRKSVAEKIGFINCLDIKTEE